VSVLINLNNNFLPSSLERHKNQDLLFICNCSHKAEYSLFKIFLTQQEYALFRNSLGHYQNSQDLLFSLQLPSGILKFLKDFLTRREYVRIIKINICFMFYRRLGHS
jgi:hypothetical protein